MTSTPLKIAHLTSVHRPFDVRILEKQCKSLASIGHQVVLVATGIHDQVLDGVQVRGVDKPKSRWERMSRTTRQIVEIALAESPDLFHLHDPELLPWAQWLRRRGHRVVYDMHENVPQDLMSKPWIPSVMRRSASSSMRLAERQLLSGLPVIFAEHSYAKSYPWIEQSEVVLNLPKLDVLPSPDTNRHAERAVGYIGAVSEDRGSLATLQALKLIKADSNEVGFECVGPFASRDHELELYRVRDRWQLDHVRFHGYLPSGDGWPIIAKTCVGLAVLQPEPNFVESYPTKIFEYMAMGLPVVVSQFPLYRDVVEGSECGICVDPADPSRIAEAILSLVDDTARASACGNRGRQAVLTRYNWDNEFQKLLRFYERILLTEEKGDRE